MLSLEEIANICNDWYSNCKKKATLNFVPMQGYDISANRIAALFNSDSVFIKVSFVDMNQYTIKEKIQDKKNDEILDFVRGLEKKGFSFAYRNKIENRQKQKRPENKNRNQSKTDTLVYTAIYPNPYLYIEGKSNEKYG